MQSHLFGGRIGSPSHRAVQPQGVISMDSDPVIDIHYNGIGDVVVACWIVWSARAIGRRVRVNTRDGRDVATVLGVSDGCLAADLPSDAKSIPPVTRLEFELTRTGQVTRFDAWCRTVGLPGLVPVRPPYCPLPEHEEWALRQWRSISRDTTVPRVLLFPEAAWPIRTWPRAYFMDLASDLVKAGWAVAAMGVSQDAVRHMTCHWWGGFSIRHAAAMARASNLIVANDSGPAHLAAAIGIPTIAICGPSDPAVVFGHEPNVRGIALEPASLDCVGCHFRESRGYRAACEVGGCQALMRLSPAFVTAAVQAFVRV
jgi:hypothetical protein